MHFSGLPQAERCPTQMGFMSQMHDVTDYGRSWACGTPSAGASEGVRVGKTLANSRKAWVLTTALSPGSCLILSG